MKSFQIITLDESLARFHQTENCYEKKIINIIERWNIFFSLRIFSEEIYY